MPQINLSTLDGPELRNLLDSARRQGRAAQTYEILQEMDARRANGERPRTLFPKRKAVPPRMIELQLGDPLDAREDPLEDDIHDDLPPLTLGEPPPREPASSAPPAPPTPEAAKRGWSHWAALIFAIGLTGGVAGGWWAAGVNRDAVAPPAAVAAARPAPQPAVQTAALAPAAPIPNADELLPAPPPPPPPEAADLTPAPTAVAAEPARETLAAAAEPTRPAVAAAAPEMERTEAPTTTQLAKASPAEAQACGAAPTPADQTICAQPRLRRLQAELRQAYAEALKAHQDRALLREHELAWREARNTVTDPMELARIYAQRIEKLKAATADAARQQQK
ncbi:MAG: hypothetical protein E7812_04065 [Phenylobacterium sp.]|nr:MAG: hypothetical protein E7812_04065 [Phenylobacterium sp.]